MTTLQAHVTPYEALGGASALHQLVSRFYELMDTLPEAYAVRKIHPESLAGSTRSLFEFLSGWLGGPSLYIAKKGHPRLRMRHAPYVVDQRMRDEWMLCMTQALTEQVIDADLRDGLNHIFSQMADHLINTDGGCGCADGHGRTVEP
ncbi:group II truncated hemoglobin [Azoarcus sp. L1K30]|uniref:group II truncated hemoglobin n=1 Tax=Azoarcus sp. L1K30 TaxID=2820277 RepID=UPI001B82173A|nr:group II truncated hemoglobin [Azoarcus sp. L1K30]MBR0565585.1 group II truncated hemoglobin [Azoarcus sp. L1K30]